jgi:prepilin-type N-terminal cleavage/methylation domain-containing protein
MEKNQDKGFTLVELLIVIVILGILATVTVFAVSGITSRGKTTACKADAKTLRTAIESYAADQGNGAYPASLLELSNVGLLSDNAVTSASPMQTDNFVYAPVAATGTSRATFTLTARAKATVGGKEVGQCDGVSI